MNEIDKFYKNKLVNLWNEPRLQFTWDDVYKMLLELNKGKEVSKSTQKKIVKMLHQMCYQIECYQELVDSISYGAEEMKELHKVHRGIAYDVLKKGQKK